MTKKTTATEEVDVLTEAAAVAVNKTEVQEEAEEIKEEIKEVEEQVEEKTEEKGDALPADHEERSKLGRTLAALHRRLDEFDGRDAQREDQLSRLVEALEKRSEPEDAVDMEAVMTRAEFEKALEERETRKAQEQSQLSQKYQSGYSVKWAELSKDLSEAEYDAIISEAEKMKYDPSENPGIDAELNFKEAQLRFLRKQMGKKETPLKDNKIAGDIGVVTNSKTIEKEGSLPKLDPAAQSYLNYVSREDGAEKATTLHKSMK